MHGDVPVDDTGGVQEVKPPRDVQRHLPAAPIPRILVAFVLPQRPPQVAALMQAQQLQDGCIPRNGFPPQNSGIRSQAGCETSACMVLQLSDHHLQMPGHAEEPLMGNPSIHSRAASSHGAVRNPASDISFLLDPRGTGRGQRPHLHVLHHLHTTRQTYQAMSSNSNVIGCVENQVNLSMNSGLWVAVPAKGAQEWPPNAPAAPDL